MRRCLWSPGVPALQVALALAELSVLCAGKNSLSWAYQFAGLEARGSLGRAAFEMERRSKRDCRDMAGSRAKAEQEVRTGDSRGRVEGRVCPALGQVPVQWVLVFLRSLASLQETSLSLATSAVCMGLPWGTAASALAIAPVPSCLVLVWQSRLIQHGTDPGFGLTAFTPGSQRSRGFIMAHFGEPTCLVRPVARRGLGTKPSLPDLLGERPRARGPWQRGERGRRKLLGFALAECVVPAGTSSTPRPGDVSGTVLQMKAPKLVWVLFPTHRVLSYESLGSPIHGVQNNELATFCQQKTSRSSAVKEGSRFPLPKHTLSLPPLLPARAEPSFGAPYRTERCSRRVSFSHLGFPTAWPGEEWSSPGLSGRGLGI